MVSVCLYIRGGGQPSRLYADEFTEDHTITEQINADGVTTEYSIENGKLTIDVDRESGIRASDGGTVNFSGDTVEIKVDAPAGDWVSSVYVYDNSSVNFKNSNTFINGFSYAGLRLESTSSFTSYNFSLNNDRTQSSNNSDRGGYGVLIDGSSFTAKGAADISLKANKNDEYTYAMYLYGTAPNAIFESLASISAEGNGVSDTVALAAFGDASVTFEDGADITAKDGSNNRGVMLLDDSSLIANGSTKVVASGADGTANYGMTIDGGYIKMGETFVKASGGDNASAIVLSGSDSITSFEGDLTAIADNSGWSQSVDISGQGNIFTAKNVSVYAEGKTARGFYVDKSNSAELDGNLTAVVDGGDYGSGQGQTSMGMALKVTGGEFSALGGDLTYHGGDGVGIDAENGGSVTFTNGVNINAALGLNFAGSVGKFGGYSEIIADSSDGTNSGIKSSLSTLNMNDAYISARGGDGASGIELSGGTADFSGLLVVEAQADSASTGVLVNNHSVTSEAGKLTAHDMFVKVDGSQAVGMGLRSGSAAELDGHLRVEASGTHGARGLVLMEKANFRGDSAYIKVTGENEEVDAAIFTNNGSAASFGGDVATDAASTAVAKGTDSSVSFTKGLVTLAETTSMTAADGAKISVNSTGAGLVAYTGTTSVSDGFIDMTLNGGGSYWRMTGDSSASTLVNNGTLLDMTADDNKFSTLTLANLNGTNGLVAMDIDASKNTDNSDIILVDDTFSGTQRVSFNRIDAQADADAAGTVIAKVNNNDGVFIAPADEEGALFYKRYLLDTKESETAGYTTDWYIKELANVDPSEKPTTTVNSVMSAASLNYHTWRTQNDKLMQRMGDLRKSGGANNGAWFRFGGSKISLGGGHGFDNEYMYYEVGYDRIIRETSKYTWFGGVAFSYGEGDSSYARGDGDNESKAVSLYLTQINKGGSYLDLVFKLGRWDDDFAVRDSYGERITGETENSGISFSAEYGKKIALNKNGFYIEPQAQLTYGHLDGDTYTTSNGVSVHQEGIESLVGRFGFNLGWDISKTSNIYLKASVLHEFLGDYGVSMSDATGRVRLSGDYGDTWFEYGLGAAFTLGKRGNDFLYFDVERSEGGDLDMEWRWNAGFRFEM